MQTIDSENKSGNLVQNAKGRLADDGEIQVKVPSAFFDFYKDQKLTKDSFTSDGWFCTSVNGRFESGKFVLNEIKKSNTVSTADKVITSDMKMLIEGKCHYVSSTILVGAGEDSPVAFLFPNHQLERPEYNISPLDGCFCPRDMDELNKCLTGCLNDANCEIGKRFSKIKNFFIVEM